MFSQVMLVWVGYICPSSEVCLNGLNVSLSFSVCLCVCPGVSEPSGPGGEESGQGLNPSRAGYYLSCKESPWEGPESDPVAEDDDPPGSDKALGTNKTYHQVSLTCSRWACRSLCLSGQQREELKVDVVGSNPFILINFFAPCFDLRRCAHA